MKFTWSLLAGKSVAAAAALACLTGGALFAEGPAKAVGEHWQLEVRAAGDGAEVVAVPKASTGEAVKLCETVSVPTTRVFLSYDDDVAVVEGGSASLGTSLQVFLLTEGTEFLEVKDWDVNEAVQKAWEKASGKKAGRSSVHFVTWSADARAALVSWSGGQESWYAVVDFDKRAVTGSLERLNRRPRLQ